MGKCSECGNKILYNAYKKIKGIIYCLKCVPKEETITVMFDETKNVDFSELAEELAKVPGTIISVPKITDYMPKKEELKILTVCKYCGCKGSSEWLELPNNEWCCKKKGCRKKFNAEYEKVNE